MDLRVRPIPRYDAPRRNALADAPRRILLMSRYFMCLRYVAAERPSGPFPRGAWERDKELPNCNAPGLSGGYLRSSLQAELPTAFPAFPGGGGAAAGKRRKKGVRGLRM
jgi:hypothetical protein